MKMENNFEGDETIVLKSHGEWMEGDHLEQVRTIKEWRAKQLRLQHNKRAQILEDIYHIRFTHLTVLYLWNNHIESIEELPRVWMPHLNYLHFSTNNIRCVRELRKAQSLQPVHMELELDTGGRHDDQGDDSLESGISLAGHSGNNWTVAVVREIAHIHFPALTWLELENNRIQSVEGLARVHAPHLRHLFLGKNNLISVGALRKADWQFLTLAFNDNHFSDGQKLSEGSFSIQTLGVYEPFETERNQFTCHTFLSKLPAPTLFVLSTYCSMQTFAATSASTAPSNLPSQEDGRGLPSHDFGTCPLICTRQHIFYFVGNPNCFYFKGNMLVSMMMLIYVTRGDRLVVSSSDVDDITIDGGPAYIQGPQTSSFFPFPGLQLIRGPNRNIPNGAEYTVEHLFGLDCAVPLHFYAHANEGFVAYFNEQQFCTASNKRNKDCLVPTAAVPESCGLNNLTIIANNDPGYFVANSHISFVSYQLVQTNDEECPEERCPQPLTWYRFPVCACECGYTSSCGPGFKWNGRSSTYSHTHRKQTK